MASVFLAYLLYGIGSRLCNCFIYLWIEQNNTVLISKSFDRYIIAKCTDFVQITVVRVVDFCFAENHELGRAAGEWCLRCN